MWNPQRGFPMRHLIPIISGHASAFTGGDNNLLAEMPADATNCRSYLSRTPRRFFNPAHDISPNIFLLLNRANFGKQLYLKKKTLSTSQSRQVRWNIVVKFKPRYIICLQKGIVVIVGSILIFEHIFYNIWVMLQNWKCQIDNIQFDVFNKMYMKFKKNKKLHRTLNLCSNSKNCSLYTPYKVNVPNFRYWILFMIKNWFYKTVFQKCIVI